jgi:hypothetical protein
MVEIIIGLDDIIGRELEAVRAKNNLSDLIPLIQKFYHIKDVLFRHDILVNESHDNDYYEQESLRRIKILSDAGYWKR